MAAILGGALVDSGPGEVTRLLAQIRSGHREAESRLISLVYVELRRLAAHYLRGERADHTLQPTALVHEAYMRLAGLHDVDWQNRAHFFATAATVMRRILVDHARGQLAQKREAFHGALSLDDALVFSLGKSAQLVDLDDALERFSQVEPRASKVVEFRFFGGLSEDEIAKVLDVNVRTVKRDWRLAKAWLYKELHRRN